MHACMHACLDWLHGTGTSRGTNATMGVYRMHTFKLSRKHACGLEPPRPVLQDVSGYMTCTGLQAWTKHSHSGSQFLGPQGPEDAGQLQETLVGLLHQVTHLRGTLQVTATIVTLNIYIHPSLAFH